MLTFWNCNLGVMHTLPPTSTYSNVLGRAGMPRGSRRAVERVNVQDSKKGHAARLPQAPLEFLGSLKFFKISVDIHRYMQAPHDGAGTR